MKDVTVDLDGASEHEEPRGMKSYATHLSLNFSSYLRVCCLCFSLYLSLPIFPFNSRCACIFCIPLSPLPPYFFLARYEPKNNEQRIVLQL